MSLEQTNEPPKFRTIESMWIWIYPHIVLSFLVLKVLSALTSERERERAVSYPGLNERCTVV